MTDTNFEKATEQAAAFQKLWMDSASKMFQASFAVGPSTSPPPEVLRQMRAGMFQALASSWEEFMRSPQFLENMKQWMESAVSFRKATNEFMAKMRNELQAPSRDDIDTLMLNIRHMEKRLLDRIEELSGQVEALQETKPSGSRAKGNGRKARPLSPAPKEQTAEAA